jgi:hypothetical protein
MNQPALGFVLTAAVTGAAGIIWGRRALLPAGAFGLLATGIQLAAVRLVRPALGAPFRTLAQRWAAGMGLRLLGVVILAVAMALAPWQMEPLPAAVGYLGVLVPLLFLEMRFLK